jgi:hypothetical protein
MLRVYRSCPVGVGEDERAPRGGEVPIGDIDGDALLALGAQAVGERGQVGRSVPALRHRGQLIGQQQLGVEQQPADQRRFVIVNRPGGGQPQQLPRIGRGVGRHDQK